MKYEKIPSNISFLFRDNELGGMTNSLERRSLNLVTRISSSIPDSRTSMVISLHNG